MRRRSTSSHRPKTNTTVSLRARWKALALITFLFAFVSASTALAAIPGAPQNLNASPGNGQVGLSWSAPSSNGGATITNYRVFRGTNSSNTLIVTSGGCANLGATFSCTDTGLSNGQSYYYIVSAVNSAGQGPPSNGATATPFAAATIPSAPQNLGATPGNGQVSLSWSAPSSNGGATITNYRVFRGTNSSNTLIVTSGGCANLGAAFSCTDTGLSNGQSYYYIVSAVNSAGQGPPSNGATATPFAAATIPSAPQNLNASPGNGQVSLSWSAPSSNGGAAITNYRVFRGTNSSNTLIVTSGGCANLGATFSCTDTGLSNGQSYYYIVSAVNSAGQGPPSNGATATPFAAATIPNAPQNLNASPGNGQVSLSWSAPSSNGGAAITNYRVFRGTNSSNTLIVTSGGCANLGATFSCADTGLSNGQSYYYIVSAVNSAGQGPPSNGATATPFAAATIPNAPQNLGATPGNGQVSLSWSAPSSDGGATITSYRVFRGTNSANTLIITSGGCANLGATLSCTDTGVSNGQSYYYIVSAVNSVGQGSPSNGATATPSGPATTIPSAPQNLGAFAGNGQVSLSWSAPSSDGGATITSYRVFRGTNSANTLIITSGGCANLGATLSCTDTGVSNGQSYYYIVSAVNSVGQGPPSNGATATSSGPATNIPGAPQNLGAFAGNGQVSLSWSAPSSDGGATITSYRVFRGTNSANTLIITSGGCANLGATLSCTETGVSNGQSYYYIVSAVNSVGQGPPSNGATATPSGPATTIPSAPQNLGAFAGNGQVSLSWSAPSSDGGATIASYRVFRGTNSSNTLIVTSGGCANLGATFSCTDTGLSNGQSYYYIVSAVNSVGQGPPSNGATATPSGPATTIPSAPQNLAATADDGKNYLGWQGPSSNGGTSITAYRVFRGTTSSNLTLVTSGGCAGLGASLACTDTGLTNGQIYYYYVSAVNSVGQGPTSSMVNATPQAVATVPSAPRNLGATADDSKNYLGWQAPLSNGASTILTYRVFRGTTSSNLQPVTSGGCGNLTAVLVCTDSGLTNGQIYYYYVSALNSAGQGPSSNMVNATPQAAASLPGAPQNLAASADDGKNYLGWQAPSSNGGATITAYRVFRGTNTFNLQIVTSGSCANLAAVLACTDTGLTNAQIYYYSIRAVNALGESSPSSVISSTPRITQTTLTVTGHVRSVTGAALSGAAVSFATSSYTGGVPTDAFGSYSLTNVPCPSSGVLRVNLQGYGPASDGYSFGSCSSPVTKDVLLTPSPIGTITGTVIDEVTLAAVRDVTISFTSSTNNVTQLARIASLNTALTDQNGVYSLFNISCLAGILSLSRPGYDDASLPYTPTTCPGASIRHLSLRPHLATRNADIRGVIRDLVTKTPLDDATISFNGVTAQSGPFGTYVLRAVRCSAAMLYVSRAGYVPKQPSYDLTSCPPTGATVDIDLEGEPLALCPLEHKVTPSHPIIGLAGEEERAAPGTPSRFLYNSPDGFIEATLDDAVSQLEKQFGLVNARLSGYRDPDYQDHLHNIKLAFDQLYALKQTNPSAWNTAACQALNAWANDEANKIHGLAHSTIPNTNPKILDPAHLAVSGASTSFHSAGPPAKALDLSIPTSRQPAVAAYLDKVKPALALPCPSDSAFHVQLATVPGCVRTQSVVGSATSSPSNHLLATSGTVGSSNVRILITDSLGRRVGYDPIEGKYINEFPLGTAVYLGAETGDPQIVITDASNVTYRLTGNADGYNPYEVSLQSLDQEHGDVVQERLADGVATPGSATASVEISVSQSSPSDGAPAKRRAVRP